MQLSQTCSESTVDTFAWRPPDIACFSKPLLQQLAVAHTNLSPSYRSIYDFRCQTQEWITVPVNQSLNCRPPSNDTKDSGSPGKFLFMILPLPLYLLSSTVDWLIGTSNGYSRRKQRPIFKICTSSTPSCYYWHPRRIFGVLLQLCGEITCFLD